MKTTFQHTARLLALALAAGGTAPAQQTTPPTGTHTFMADMTYDPVARSVLAALTAYYIEDGFTVTFRNGTTAGGGTVFRIQNAAHTLTIAPSGPLGTGRVVFRDNISPADGGVLVNAGGNISITNAAFIANSATGATNSLAAGVLMVASGGGNNEFTNVLFQDNHANRGGVFGYNATAGSLTVTSGTFIGNYAAMLAGGGVVVTNVSSARHAQTTFKNSVFRNNRAYLGGVAAHSNNADMMSDFIFIDPLDISDNWAWYAGGVIHDRNDRSKDATGYSTLLRFTGSTARTDFTFANNAALGINTNSLATLSAGVAAQVSATNGSWAATGSAPKAQFGGFYYTSTNSLLTLDLAAGVTLAIGTATGAPALDTFATADTGTGALVEKKGPGTLALHADNAYWQGLVNVDAGTLILGGTDNDHARLGGLVTVATGATLAGTGTLTTLKANGTAYAGRTAVAIGTGATLRAGLPGAAAGVTLAIDGAVTLADGAILAHDLFPGDAASLLQAGSITLAGAATVNLGLLETGTFTLARWDSGNLAAASLSLTVNNAAPTARAAGTLAVETGTLTLTNQVHSLEMRFAPGTAAGFLWQGREGPAVWSDNAATNPETIFRNGDRALFDDDADAPGDRAITIAAPGVTVADLIVSGSAGHTFAGAGGITADPDTIEGTLITGTGLLVKTGPGALTFANTGTNHFAGGIRIEGGLIAFDHPRQLVTGAGADITFAGTGTLRALAGATGTLASAIAIGAGQTAVVDIAPGDSPALGGALSSASDGSVLRKTGAGTLLLLADSAANTGAVAVDEGALVLDGAAKLGGAITVAAGATLGGSGEAGAGGSVTLASGATLAAGAGTAQSGTLAVHNLTATGGAVFQFDLFNTADGALKTADRLAATGTAQISGTNIIDITTLASGTFNLGNITALAGATVLLNNMELPDAGRISAALSDGGGWLRLVASTDKSRTVTWTGSSGSSWSAAAQNWAGSGGVTQYSYGDHALFDGGADNRDISIDGALVRLSGMEVTGTGDYTFAGPGGIDVRPDSVMDDNTAAEITAPTGKLVKTGAGTLTFANAADNTFAAGIELCAGAIAFSRADHLGTGTAAISFLGDAALRANAGGIELPNTLDIAADVTATLDTGAHSLALTGTLLGDADTALAKDGDGTLLLAAAADLSAFSGTLAVRSGTLRAGAAGQFVTPAIHIDTGATLDLAGHDQSLGRLAGAGEIALGTARLTHAVAGDTDVFAGSFSGSGSVVKTGAGKWILSGSSDHTGGTILEAGSLGLASSRALGDGALTVNATAATLVIETGGIALPNAIHIAADGVTVQTEGREAALTGPLAGGVLTVTGGGTLALSGNNAHSALAIKGESRVVARRAGAVSSGPVTIDNGSVLEFQNVSAGQMTASVTGDRLLFTSSTLALLAANTLGSFETAARSDITAAAPGALGGAAAAITVRDGSVLRAAAAVTGGNLSVDGGALLFDTNASGSVGTLTLTGTLAFANGGEIRLGAVLPTGVYDAATAAGGITGALTYEPHQGQMFMVADIVGGDTDTLRITAYNKALEPGKDITVGYDALRASLRSLQTHVTEDFLTPLVENKTGAPARGRWYRLLGSFAEYSDDNTHLGYTNTHYAALLGYDWITAKDILVGGYLGFSVDKLKTTNDATTDLDLPHAGLYGAFKKGNFHVLADLSAGLGGADTRRTEEFGRSVTGGYDLATYGAGLEIGCTLHNFAEGGLRPSLGLHYLGLRFSDHKENGGGAVRLDDFDSTSLQAWFGCEMTRKINLPWGLPGAVAVKAGWRENLVSKTSDVRATLVAYPGASFQIRGDRYDPGGVTGGVGVRMLLARNALLSVSYDFDGIPGRAHGSNPIRHTLDALIRISW
jgi:autotransporter-associated beta strand protein